MAYGPLSHYLQQVSRALQKFDGDVLAELVSFRHPHYQNPRLQQPNYEEECESCLPQPFDEIIAAHIRCAVAVTGGDPMDAYAAQAVVVQSFLKGFQSQKEENWALPVLKTVTLDLRLLALKVEVHLSSRGHRKPEEMLEKAADQLMACFRVCVNDNRASLDCSKRWGTLALVNQLFKIYFRINKLHLCKPLIRAIDSADIKEQFCLADTVTYRYFVGRKAMFDSEYKHADELLEYAFRHCYHSCRRNKRLVLIYLIPVKMLLGQLPKLELLQKYNIMQYAQVSKAVSQGNLMLLSETMQRNEAFFIHYRVYLILEKLKIIAYRNLIKKIYLLLGTHQLPLQAFEGALRFMGEEDMDIDEAQCILANLIDKSYIRGYISHQHQKLVVSKQNPFPVLSTILT